MVNENKPGQSGEDDIIDLLDVVEVGKGVPFSANDAAEADFSAEFDNMLNDLEAKEAEDTPFPDPTPVEHEVDANESLDLPSMDDLDSLLAELGASKAAGGASGVEQPGVKDNGLDSDARGLNELSEMPDSTLANKDGVAAALDKALSDLNELDTLDDALADADKALSEETDKDNDLDSALDNPHDNAFEDDLFADAENRLDAARDETAMEQAVQPAVLQHIEPLSQEEDIPLDMADLSAPHVSAPLPDGTAPVVIPSRFTSAERPEVSVDMDDLPLDVRGFGGAVASAASAGIAPSVPAPVEETGSIQATVENGRAMSASTRIDEDLNELDALLDNMLSAAPVTAAAAGHGQSGAADNDEDAPAVSDQLDDILERLDNLEEADSTRQLFERCASIEENLNRQRGRLDAIESDSLSRQDLTSSLDEKITQETARIAELESLLAAQSGQMNGFETMLNQKDAQIEELRAIATAQQEQLAGLESALATFKESQTGFKDILSGLQESLTSVKESQMGFEEALAGQKRHSESMDENMEKLVAAAAAKVIREEIAALIGSLREGE